MFLDLMLGIHSITFSSFCQTGLMYIFNFVSQSSRVLKLDRYSLQYLLQQFCGVTANKEYVVFTFWNYPLLPVSWHRSFIISYGITIPFILTNILEGWQVNSLQIPECRLEITPSSWCDAKVQLCFNLITFNPFLILPVV